MQKWNGQLLRKFDDPVEGNSSVGTTVVVRKTSDNSLAVVYDVDDTNSVQKNNPFVTDDFGRYSFYAPSGKYTIEFGDGSDDIEITLVDNLTLQELNGLTEPSDLDQVHIRVFNSIAEMKAANYLQVGQLVRTKSYYEAADGEPLVGGAFYEIVENGSGVADDGSFINLNSVSLQAKQLFMQNGVDVTTFGAKSDVNCSPIIQRACDYLATKNSFEGSTSLYFNPVFTYRLDTQILLTVAHGPMRWWSDGNASLDVRNLAAQHPLVVDYSTNGTANFLKFDMENLHWTDTSLSYARRGPHFKRVIGSRFVNCHFNYLAISLAIDEDSNLNHFDSCQWRGNKSCIVGYVSVANNNVFTNCQWRYNTETILDCLGNANAPGTFEGTIFNGGDFEPYNSGSPMVRANKLSMRNMRVERNSTVSERCFEVYDDCTFEDIDIHSDGATQAYGFEVIGANNRINIKSFGGDLAIYLKTTSSYNIYSVGQVSKLSQSRAFTILDEGSNNTVVAEGIPQTKGLKTKDNYIITPDLTQWVAVGCSVTYDSGEKEYTIVADGTQSTAYIYAYFSEGIGGYNGQCIGITVNPINPSGQVLVRIEESLTANLGAGVDGIVGKWCRRYHHAFNYQTPPPSKPYFIIELFGAGAGAAVKVRDVAIGFSKNTPSL